MEEDLYGSQASQSVSRRKKQNQLTLVIMGSALNKNIFFWCLALFLVLSPVRLPGQNLSAISGNSLYEVTYRPPITWYELKTPHFSILYPRGTVEEARSTGRILESQYEHARQLVGGSLQHFPVLLNPQNDRSNGFVSPVNFRMEIEMHPTRGKTLNPRSGNWLESVLPHELIHALQLNHHDSPGLSRLLYPFSPDIARSIHTGVPLGILEGLAVHHETESVLPRGGRGSYPFFTGLFDATFDTEQQWSMGQMVHTSSRTRPLNRHYVGGYTFTRWLQEQYGNHTSREAISFYSRYPFLGYGFALRHTTGQWPGELYDIFEEQMHKRRSTSETGASSVTQSKSFQKLPVDYKGAEIRRPLWLSKSRLLFYGDFYNGRSGFYTYDLDDMEARHLYETRLIEDFRFDLNAERDTLIFARYHTHPVYDQHFTARIHQLKIPGGRDVSSPSIKGSAPAYGKGKSVWSIRNHKTSTVLQRHPPSDDDDSGSSSTSYQIDSTKIVAVQPHPLHPDTLALIANRRGVQGLWITSVDQINTSLSNSPDVAFQEGSVFDPAWHPSGDHLLFSSDHTGRLQIYEYQRSPRAVHQLTDHHTNAFEPSYRPDGQWIAYIVQDKNQKRPAVLKRNDFVNLRVPPETWQPDASINQRMHRAMVGDSLFQASQDWSAQPYHTGMSWLKPRTIIPSLNSSTGEIGVQLFSGSLLQNHKYSADVTYGLDQFWYDIEYRNADFVPGFELSHSRQPILQPNNNHISHLEWRQYQTTLPFTYTIENNVRFTALNLRPSLSLNQYRAHNSQQNLVTPFWHYLTSQFNTSLNYRLQQNIRDVQPNSGVHLFAELKSDLHQWNASSRGRGIHTGTYLFLSPLRKLNQSLRIGSEWIFQSSADGLFNAYDLGMQGFHPNLFQNTPRAFEINTRYTIPLFYPDDGGFFIPLYFSNVYLVGFSKTVGRLESHFPDSFPHESRTLYGGGLRVSFRVSNLSVDLGIALTFEPTRRSPWYRPSTFIGTF